MPERIQLRRNPITVTVEQDGDRQVVVSKVVVDEASNGPTTLRLASHLDPSRPLDLTTTVAPKTAAERLAAIRAQIEHEHAEVFERTLQFIERHGFDKHREVSAISRPFAQRAELSRYE